MNEYRRYADACIDRLQQWYNTGTGLWDEVGWWNNANILEAVIDYSALTQTNEYDKLVIDNTFVKTKQANSKNNRDNFGNRKYDDQLWYCLTWIKAFDLIRNIKYLDMAKTIFKQTTSGRDTSCGGGIWWGEIHDKENRDESYKNAITNELFLTAAARLYLRTDDYNYLDKWALPTLNWLLNSEMFQNNLFYDRLDFDCELGDNTVWTYNQGVILGGLSDMYRITKDVVYLSKAQNIADTAIKYFVDKEDKQRILVEQAKVPPSDPNAPQFKGVFIRYLAYFIQTLTYAYGKETDGDYSLFIKSATAYIGRNVTALWGKSRTPDNTFGYNWNKRCDRPDAVQQSAALDAFNAALLLEGFQ